MFGTSASERNLGNTMSRPDKCRGMCRLQSVNPKYEVFGLQNGGSECFCGYFNEFNTTISAGFLKRPESECSSGCVDDQNQWACGGSWRMSVYTIQMPDSHFEEVYVNPSVTSGTDDVGSVDPERPLLHLVPFQKTPLFTSFL